MSVKVMAWAWQTKLKGNRKLILLALADHSDDEGKCWPGLKNIAKKCGVSRSNIIEHVNALEKSGFIKKQNRYADNGGYVSNLYFLNFGFETGGLKSVLGESKKTTHRSPKSEPGVVQNLDTKHHIEPSSINNIKTTADIAAVLLANKNQLEKADLIIGNTLTSTQKELVHKIITPLCTASNLNPSQIIAEANYALLDKKNFTNADIDFIKKLNTIAKCIRNGKWFTPVGIFEAEKAASHKKETELAKKLSELESEYNTCLSFLEFAKQKNDATAINFYQKQIEQIEAQIRRGTEC